MMHMRQCAAHSPGPAGSQLVHRMLDCRRVLSPLNRTRRPVDDDSRCPRSRVDRWRPARQAAPGRAPLRVQKCGAIPPALLVRGAGPSIRFVIWMAFHALRHAPDLVGRGRVHVGSAARGPGRWLGGSRAASTVENHQAMPMRCRLPAAVRRLITQREADAAASLAAACCDCLPPCTGHDGTPALPSVLDPGLAPILPWRLHWDDETLPFTFTASATVRVLEMKPYRYGCLRSRSVGLHTEDGIQAGTVWDGRQSVASSAWRGVCTELGFRIHERSGYAAPRRCVTRHAISPRLATRTW